MKFLIYINMIVISCLAMFPNVVKAEEILLLNLQYKSDKTTTREIQFYGNDIDPNSTSIDDSFSLKIDGKSIEVPEPLYRRLETL